MKFNLAAIVKQAKRGRRKAITLRPIQPTQALASSLYLATYKRIIVAAQATIERIIAAYPRAIGDSAMITDAVDDLQGILDDFDNWLTRLLIDIAPELQDWVVQVERWHRDQWRGAVLTATGINLTTMLIGSGTPQSVQQTIDWNTSLIRSVSDEARSRIGNLVFAAVRNRTPVADLARDLRDAVAMSKTRSLRIASDQTKKLSAALDQERQMDAGLDSYIWHHSFKRHPRHFHVARDGKVFRWDDPPADGPPGSLPYCGCRAQAYIEL